MNEDVSIKPSTVVVAIHAFGQEGGHCLVVACESVTQRNKGLCTFLVHAFSGDLQVVDLIHIDNLVHPLHELHSCKHRSMQAALFFGGFVCSVDNIEDAMVKGTAGRLP